MGSAAQNSLGRTEASGEAGGTTRESGQDLAGGALGARPSTSPPPVTLPSPPGLELGPQPQGVLRADDLARMRTVVASALDFVELFNRGETPGAWREAEPGSRDGVGGGLTPVPHTGTAFPAFEMDAYRYLDGVDFPRTADGELAGTVHPQLQVCGVHVARPTPWDAVGSLGMAGEGCPAGATGSRARGADGRAPPTTSAFPLQDCDFEPLRPGAPIFQMFSRKDVFYQGDSTVYPIFINEAAYYEKGVAFIQTEKISFSVPALP